MTLEDLLRDYLARAVRVIEALEHGEYDSARADSESLADDLRAFVQDLEKPTR